MIINKVVCGHERMLHHTPYVPIPLTKRLTLALLDVMGFDRQERQVLITLAYE
jgi:hypothetical protein